jgi:hypothetical protein
MAIDNEFEDFCLIYTEDYKPLKYSGSKKKCINILKQQLFIRHFEHWLSSVVNVTSSLNFLSFTLNIAPENNMTPDNIHVLK